MAEAQSTQLNELFLGCLLGISASMQRVVALIQKVSRGDFPVLIMGESGTGKELAARALHTGSKRKHGPFVPVDCAALASELLESELFGHVRGAFTGAEATRIGLLQSAHGGTIFLDEIGEMPLGMQAKLLRALQEHEVRPVGSNQITKIDVRVIAATNRTLWAEVQDGRFRQDLYFRLNVMQINMPPLRERQIDIPLLAEMFRERLLDLRPQATSFSKDAMDHLIAYEWPGNVRELENAVEHAMALGSGPILELEDFPATVAGAKIETVESTDCETLVPLEDMERRLIFRALEHTNGDKLAASRLLRIGKTTLYRKLDYYRNRHSHAVTSAAR
jgi:two-component system, NtrC family, response regulator AtoC